MRAKRIGRTSKPRHNVLLLVERLVDPCSDNLDVRVGEVHCFQPFGARNEVEEDDSRFGDAVRDDDLDGLDCRATSCCEQA